MVFFLCIIVFLIFGSGNPPKNEASVSQVAESYAPKTEEQTELNNIKSVDMSIIDGERFLKKSILSHERNLKLFMNNIINFNISGKYFCGVRFRSPK